MAYIGPLPAETFTSFATQEFSTSATTSYTLDHPVTNENELALFINNVRQQPGSGKAYTAVGTALTLSAATASTDTMYAVFLGRALQTVNPADASVGTSQLAATSVTAAKLNNDIISGTTALAEEPADTDEFLLSDGGTLKRIDYSYIKGGGGLVFLNSQTASISESVAFNSTYITSTYEVYKIFATDIIAASDNVNFRVHYSDDNGSNYDKTFRMAVFGFADTGSSVLYNQETSGSGTTTLNAGRPGTASDEQTNMEFTLYKPSGGYGYAHYTLAIGQSNGYMAIHQGACRVSESDAINNVKFDFHSGNIASGTFRLYGVVNS